jgi:hypothetical protein
MALFLALGLLVILFFGDSGRELLIAGWGEVVLIESGQHQWRVALRGFERQT